MKRPSFQFYPADWRKDNSLQFCSLSARGLWVEIMCIAHECNPYGFLRINGKPMTVAQIARMVGISERECAKLLDELFEAGVPSKADDGAIFSRRMVRDQEVRERRSEGGKLGAVHGEKGAIFGAKGGRPRSKKTPLETPLCDDVRGVFEPPSEPPLKPPPSSSSSSSDKNHISVVVDVGAPTPLPPKETQTAHSAKRGTRLNADWQCPEEWVSEGMSIRTGWSRIDLLRVADAFRDYWVAVPGARGLKSDWRATWRNWCRNQREPQPNGQRKSIHEARAETIAALTGANKNHERIAADPRDITAESVRIA